MKPRTRSSRHPLHHPPHHPLCLTLRPLAFSLACMGMAPALAQVILPSYQPGMFATQGTVTVNPVTTASPRGGQALGITQGSLRAIIDWHSFSIGAKDAVNIQQALGPSRLLL